MKKKLSLIKNLFTKNKPQGTDNASVPEVFDVLGLETSYACNLRCKMCPRVYNEQSSGFLSMENFNKLKPYLKRFRFACLAGYGEPLLNPNFAAQIKGAKEQSCHVSFITNGLLLKGAMLDRIIDTGVNEIVTSIDAGTAKTYEYVREKGLFSNIMSNLKEIKERLANLEEKPLMHWAFVIMKYNQDELLKAVQIASDMGYKKITVKHLESAQSKEDLKDALFNTEIAPDLSKDEEKKYKDIISAAKELADKNGLEFSIHPRRFEINGTCLVNPLRSIFIDYQGNLSACCYLNNLKVMPYNTHKPAWNGVVGNVFKTPLDEILNRKEYIDFRGQWSRGVPPDCCKGCLQITRMRLKQEG